MSLCDHRQVPGFTRAELEAARERTIQDVLPGPDDPPLRVLFCGINPGLVSAATGHHFARPGNRFWPALHGAGFTPRLLRPAEQWELPALGLGITNMAPRATARADELTPAELVAGAVRLRGARGRAPAARGSRSSGSRPTARRSARPAPSVGPQEEPLGGTGVWVLPNPSGLNAHWQLPEMIAEYARLRAAAGAPNRRHECADRAEIADVSRVRSSRASRVRGRGPGALVVGRGLAFAGVAVGPLQELVDEEDGVVDAGVQVAELGEARRAPWRW